MALPELKPQLNQETTSPNPDMKISWVQKMLDAQKAEAAGNAKPASALNFITDNGSKEAVAASAVNTLDKALNTMGANSPEITKTAVLQPKETVPAAPDYSKSITLGFEGKPLSGNPQSGSILRVLMDVPGMKSKIDNGLANGHTYNIVHQPGQKSFWFWDNWEETNKTTGVVSKRKVPTMYEIKEELPPVVKPEQETLPESPLTISISPSEVAHVEVPEDIVLEPTEPMEEILKPPVQEQAFVKIPMIPEDDESTNPDKLPKVKNEIPLDQAPNSHFRLMRARFAKQEFNQKYPTEQAKAGHQERVDQNNEPGFVTKIREYEAQQEAAKPTFLEWAFGTKPEGKTLEQWNVMKNVPTDAFMNPEKYSWEGMPQDLTIENYPEEFKSLRNKVMNAVEELGHRGEDLKSLSLEKALEKAVNLDLV